jgi:hypothetical protein
MDVSLILLKIESANETSPPVDQQDQRDISRA